MSSSVDLVAFQNLQINNGILLTNRLLFDKKRGKDESITDFLVMTNKIRGKGEYAMWIIHRVAIKCYFILLNQFLQETLYTFHLLNLTCFWFPLKISYVWALFNNYPFVWSPKDDKMVGPHEWTYISTFHSFHQEENTHFRFTSWVYACTIKRV